MHTILHTYINVHIYTNEYVCSSIFLLLKMLQNCYNLCAHIVAYE